MTRVRHKCAWATSLDDDGSWYKCDHWKWHHYSLVYFIQVFSCSIFIEWRYIKWTNLHIHHDVRVRLLKVPNSLNLFRFATYRTDQVFFWLQVKLFWFRRWPSADRSWIHLQATKRASCWFGLAANSRLFDSRCFQNFLNRNQDTFRADILWRWLSTWSFLICVDHSPRLVNR